ncbi:50S ribosomal protein L10 [Candidatus Woesearchaeota archaeon]|jgi:large subunit ribosomal protein L10|nr:50S ribosomal protein L10 [Candidatus Woesearchaeota archaeon]MDP6648134.1 50S ribosomal protein L10 [Candidatus Woesearchaeota archaeon]|tara:strand:+ start:3361 stop:4626 length:1266 start_codon:yes stop_codon:yes gene_type:complete
MTQIQAHVAEYKKKIVGNLVNLISKNPIVGVVNMENLPAPQLQKMRAQLRGKFYITMTKRRLIKLAFEKSKSKTKGIEELESHLGGMPALIFTKENPFKLSKTLQKSKSPAPAKAGQTAPRDIVVNKGATPFAPGPIIGELAVAGIKSGVEGGKVAIKEDTVVVKAGEKIKPKVAEILTRLGVEPMEVGLDLVAVLENGLIYKRDILSIDESEYINRLSNASRWAFNLANFVSYPTKETIKLLIGKAFNDAKSLGIAQEIFDKVIIDSLLGKAEQQMLSLKAEANIQVVEKKVEEPTKEKVGSKPEVKKEEAKPEPKKEVAKSEEKKEKIEAKPEVKKEESKPKTEEKQKEEPKPEKKIEEVKPKTQDPKQKAESTEIKAPTREELEANIRMREKEKEIKDVEKIAQDLQRKAIKDQEKKK